MTRFAASAEEYALAPIACANHFIASHQANSATNDSAEIAGGYNAQVVNYAKTYFAASDDASADCAVDES